MLRAGLAAAKRGRHVKCLVAQLLSVASVSETEALHREMAAAARNAAAGAERVLSDVRAQRAEQGKPTTVTVARCEIRKWLEQSEEGAQVEKLVAQLLG